MDFLLEEGISPPHHPPPPPPQNTPPKKPPLLVSLQGGILEVFAVGLAFPRREDKDSLYPVPPGSPARHVKSSFFFLSRRGPAG